MNFLSSFEYKVTFISRIFCNYLWQNTSYLMQMYGENGADFIKKYIKKTFVGLNKIESIAVAFEATFCLFESKCTYCAAAAAVRQKKQRRCRLSLLKWKSSAAAAACMQNSGRCPLSLPPL